MASWEVRSQSSTGHYPNVKLLKRSLKPSVLELPGWYSMSTISLGLSSKAKDTLESIKSSSKDLSSGLKLDTLLSSSLCSRLLD